jgi:hypothetical protein
MAACCVIKIAAAKDVKQFGFYGRYVVNKKQK